MALNDIELERLKLTVKKASEELGTKELVYFSEWAYFLPSHTLKMNEVSLPEKYDIPTGWNGFGTDDLEKLEKVGFLVKTFEWEEESFTFEKIIKYLIVEQ
ncbi:hypothetical protein [Flavobacterium tyrosinilyticum]|uniref:hypothetical protein n=1 Tax=Flavobacterium tyrosinilyticum TaxID=1658740 RepID=UPI00202EEF2E|nr:hypothetical protein [Flavobacterium tyrosinilyticum]MCM0666535.1 hypothetical protein [Flavobacterium tyrosinilyticum]